MAAQKPKVKVEGQRETIRALEQVKEFDVKKAEARIVQDLLPAVRSGTRVATGLLSNSWEAQESNFINAQDYAIPQEYGTKYIEGAYAIRGAWESSEDKIEEIMGQEVERSADKAGFKDK